MASNKQERSSKPKTEGEKHQGVGVKTPAKGSTDQTKTGKAQPDPSNLTRGGMEKNPK